MKKLTIVLVIAMVFSIQTKKHNEVLMSSEKPCWAIGTDHRGFAHKEYIKQSLPHIEWLDVGAYDDERSDYPDFAKAVAQAMLDGRASAGILLCGSGIGMAVTANRFKGIYAGLAWNEEVARHGRERDNVNLLVIPADFMTADQAVAMIRVWEASSFIGGRYAQRLEKID